jgi:hypothetical protein
VNKKQTLNTKKTRKQILSIKKKEKKKQQERAFLLPFKKEERTKSNVRND